MNELINYIFIIVPAWAYETGPEYNVYTVRRKSFTFKPRDHL